MLIARLTANIWFKLDPHSSPRVHLPAKFVYLFSSESFKSFFFLISIFID